MKLAFLFPGDRDEENRPCRTLSLVMKLGRHFEDGGRARRVVHRAVVDLVALERRILAEVIPVGRVDDVLVLLRAALDLADDVVTLNFPGIDLYIEARLAALERDRLEVLLHRRGLERIEIQAGIAQQFFSFL